MQKNVSTTGALIRITCGLVGLVWSTSYLSRRPSCIRPMLIAVISAMKVAEGITRFCPLKAMLGNNKSSSNNDLVMTHFPIPDQLDN